MDKIYLNPNEVKLVAMLVGDFLQLQQETKHFPFNPEAREMQKEMNEAAVGIKRKLIILGVAKEAFDPVQYEEGDENQFLTKES